MRRLVGVDADPSVGERSLGGVLHPPNRYRLTRRIRSVFGTNEDVVPPHGDDGVGLAGDRGDRLPDEVLKVRASIEPRRRSHEHEPNAAGIAVAAARAMERAVTGNTAPGPDEGGAAAASAWASEGDRPASPGLGG